MIERHMRFRDQVEVAAAGRARLELGQGMKGWTVNGSVAISALDLQNSGVGFAGICKTDPKNIVFPNTSLGDSSMVEQRTLTPLI
jgi:hypothetical protein